MILHKNFQAIAILVVTSFLLLPFWGCSRHKLTSHYDIEKRALTSPESVHKLILAMDDSDEDVRARAVVYLSRIGIDAHEAIPRMKQAAESDLDERVKENALWALASIYENKDEAIQYFEDYITSSEDQKLKALAQRAIARVQRSSSSYGTIEIKDGPTRNIAVVNLTPKFNYDNGYQGNSRPVPWCAVLPLRINIKNLSSSKIRIDPEDITLFAPNATGNPSKGLSATEASTKLEYSMKKAVTKAILLFPFSIGSPFNAARANQIVAKHTKKSILKKMQIEPLDDGEGYLYFSNRSDPP